MKHIPASLYGKCAPTIHVAMFESNDTWKCPRNMREGCLEEIQRHKFYLAFENSLCVDDVTPGGVLPIMAYTGRLRQKGVPFSGFRYIKG